MPSPQSALLQAQPQCESLAHSKRGRILQKRTHSTTECVLQKNAFYHHHVIQHHVILQQSVFYHPRSRQSCKGASHARAHHMQGRITPYTVIQGRITPYCECPWHILKHNTFNKGTYSTKKQVLKANTASPQSAVLEQWP
jgi:hypothetical protein